MSSTAEPPAGASLVLPVPRVGFYDGRGNPEDYPLPSVFRAVLEFQREDLGLKGRERAFDGGWQWQACALFFGVSGQGFRFIWELYGPDEAYLGPDLMRMYDDSFAAAGYVYEAVLKPDLAKGLNAKCVVSDDESEYRRRVVESIRDRRMPVLALGLFGPPEPGIIAGYDDEGAVLIGWDHFQDSEENKVDPRVSHESSGMYRKRDWFRDVKGILVLKERRDRPDPARLHRSALLRCLRDLAALERGDRAVGLGSYAEWLGALLDDAFYAGADQEALRKRHDLQHGMVGDIAERRAYAATYMTQAADALPGAADDLLRAAECFDVMHDLCWRAWQTVGTSHIKNEDAPANLARPEVRRELVAIALLHRDLDARAARHIARALRKLGEEPATVASVPELKPRDSYTGIRTLPYFVADLDEPVQAERLDQSSDAYEHGKFLQRPLLLNGDLEADAAAAREAGFDVRVEELAPGDALRREQLTTDVVLSIFHGLPVTVGLGEKRVVIAGFHIWSMNYLLAQADNPEGAPTRTPHTDPAIHGPFLFLDPRS